MSRKKKKSQSIDAIYDKGIDLLIEIMMARSANAHKQSESNGDLFSLSGVDFDDGNKPVFQDWMDQLGKNMPREEKKSSHKKTVDR